MNLLESLITSSNREKKEAFPQTTSPVSPPSPPEPVFAASMPSPEARALLDLPDSVLTARYPLAEICRLTLEGNPEARQLSPNGRLWIAKHLEAAVLCWFAHLQKPEPAWDATCPKGHAVTDGIFVRALMGWVCESCEQVYPGGACRIVNSKQRQDSASEEKGSVDGL